MVEQIRNLGFDRIQFHAIDPRLTGRDQHFFAFKQQTRMNTIDARPPLYIVKHHILDLRLDPEHTLARFERKLCDIAFQGQSHVIRVSGLDAVFQPIDGSIAYHLGQVAIHRRAINTRQMYAQINQTGLVSQQFIVSLGRSGYIRVGETSILQHQLSASRRFLPATLRIQGVKCQGRISKQIGQINRQLP